MDKRKTVLSSRFTELFLGTCLIHFPYTVTYTVISACDQVLHHKNCRCEQRFKSVTLLTNVYCKITKYNVHTQISVLAVLWFDFGLLSYIYVPGYLPQISVLTVLWFFFQIAMIYMCTRLFVNVSQIYLPLYITETLKMEKVRQLHINLPL